MSSMASGMEEKPSEGRSRSNSSLSMGNPLVAGAVSAPSVPNAIASGCISIPTDWSLVIAATLLPLEYDRRPPSPDINVALVLPSPLIVKDDLLPNRIKAKSDVYQFDEEAFTPCSPLNNLKFLHALHPKEG